MDINLSYDQLNDEYSMLMSVLGASVSKHLLDGHFTCIWANDYYYDLIRYPKSEYETRFHNHCDEFFWNNPEGWKLLTEKVSSTLASGEKRFSLYLPMLYPDGGTYWVKMQSAFTEDFIGGYRVSYTIMTDVTEMMHARQEKEQSQQLIEKILHEQEMLMSALNVSVSKHLIDEHYTLVRANEFYYQLIGYPKEKYERLFHNHPDEFYHDNPEGWTMLTKTVNDVLARGEDYYELIVPMKYEDGSTYWVKLVSYFTDEYIDGFRTSYTVMSDVTELVRTRTEQEMLMRSMKVSVSKHLVDEHFTVVWANDFYYQLIGYSKAEYEALFHNHCDEYFKNNISSWEAINKKVAAMHGAGEKSYEVFLPMRVSDGSVSWVKMVGFFTNEYQDGKQMAYTTMVDVTDLMQVQQEKSIAYDNIPGFIVKHRILGDRIVMVDSSDRLQEIFDVDLDQLSAFDPLAPLLPESQRFIMENFPRLRRGEPLEGTICIQDSSEKLRWFQIHSTCIDVISEDPVYLTVFIDITDITELRELQRKLEERTELLNDALEAARRANEAKSDFLSRMSHDIRTPMNVISGMTEIADTHLDNPQRVRDCLQKIRLSSHHLLGLINDVLDMSQIENRNFTINKTALSLPEALQEVIMISLSGIRAKGQVFNAYLKNLRQEQYLSDALRLRQILLNLLSNASKFTPEGGKIVFGVEQLPSADSGDILIRFTISDNGVGMEADFLDQIFEPFAREKDSRTDRIEGSGLGMAITKRLVDFLGGTIAVQSHPNKGTSFQVTLPMEAIPASGSENSFPGVRMLLVDDDPETLRYCSQTLGELGVDVECAASGREAVSRAAARCLDGQGYDLALIDWIMDGMNGLKTAREIREACQDAAPLLILSSFDTSVIKEEALSAGIDGFMEKPYFCSTLIGGLNKYLKGTEASRDKTVRYDFSGYTILLAEDNELNREIVLELLGRLGAGIVAAANGREAVERFQSSPPEYFSLILMDIQMPLMNGYDAARAIRALQREDAKSVPIIAMTADAFAENITAAREAGMDGHISKPIDLELMYKTLGHCLHLNHEPL